jgi:hypothetical protein
MDLTLAIQGGGAAAAVYAVHLLARALRDPRELGAFLPRLRSGWHSGMREAEIHSALRRLDLDLETPEGEKQFRRLIGRLASIETTSVEVLGQDEPADFVRRLSGRD